MKKSIWNTLEAVDRRVLYLILAVVASAGLFVKAEIKVDPDAYAKDWYAGMMTLPPDKPILLQTDWTNSTRGENAGHMEAILRLLMARKIKFLMYAFDPQSPQVARDVIRRINKERADQGLAPYKPWIDYVDAGYFPNAENSLVAVGNNPRNFFNSKRVKDDAGNDRMPFDAPFMTGTTKLGDFSTLVVITASDTIDYAVQRLSGRIPIYTNVTGVVGPGVLPYYQSKQLAGVGVGLKGVYDIEYMMTFGINYPSYQESKTVRDKDKQDLVVPPLSEGAINSDGDKRPYFGRGARYYVTFHFVMFLMILAIILGNVAMFAGRRRTVRKH